ncbi:MAG: DNA-3-methyladenine glycosylase I [Nitriliruptoraceae bacterium]
MLNDPPPSTAAIGPGLLRHEDGRARCWWCGSDPLYVAYHDQEWGRPVREERLLFEKLCLEAFQSGLSWLTILRKRAAFRVAFAGFDAQAVARFGASDVDRLLTDVSIVRNRAKIEATILNAQALCRLWDRGETLRELAWDAASPGPRPRSPEAVPAHTPASGGLARRLKERGFRFVGPTTAYAFLQAMGLVDDHLDGCSVPVGSTGPGAEVPWVCD